MWDEDYGEDGGYFQVTPTESELQSHLKSVYQQELRNRFVTLYEYYGGKLAVPLSEAYNPLIVRPSAESVLYIRTDSTFDLIIPEALKKVLDRPTSFYRDLFRKFNEEGETKVTFLMGKPGTGKSMFCRHLVDLWCNAPDEETVRDDVRFIKEFDFVFLVSFRHAETNSSVMDMIDSQLFPDQDEFFDEMKRVIQKKPEKCLLLLDGLDEWSSLPRWSRSLYNPSGMPSKELVWHCKQLVTARPHRLEAMTQRYNKDYKVMEIKGFNRDTVPGYVQRILEALGDSDATNTAEEFRRQAVEHDLEHLFRNPFLLKTLFDSWYFKDGQAFRISVCSNYLRLIEALITRGVEEEAVPGEKFSRLSLLDSHRRKPKDDPALQMPACFQGLPLCTEHYPMLYMLGNIAFAILFNTEQKKDPNVYSRRDVELNFQLYFVDVARRIGFLSQAKERSDSMLLMCRLTFINKKVQEFLAAIWMCGKQFTENLKAFREKCTTITDVVKYDLFIRFVCGLFPEKGRELCQYVLSLMDTELERVGYRHSEEHVEDFKAGFAVVVRQIQNLLVNCTRESQCFLEDGNRDEQQKSPSRSMMQQLFSSAAGAGSQPWHYCISDVYVDSSVQEASLDLLYSQVLANTKLMKSLVFTDVPTPPAMLKAVRDMPQLERLHIALSDEDHTEAIEKLHKSLYKHQSLKSFGFHFVSKIQDSVTKQQWGKLLSALRSITSLTTLHVRRLAAVQQMDFEFPPQIASIALDRVDLEIVSSVQFPPTVTSIDLFDVTLPLQPFQLPAGLKWLRMRKIKVKHPALPGLLATLQPGLPLQSLSLGALECSDCAEPCQFSLNLANQRQIQHLELMYLNTNVVHFHPDNLEHLTLAALYQPGVTSTVLSRLQQAPNLTRLSLGDPLPHKLPREEVAVFKTVVSRLVRLVRLELKNLEFDGNGFAVPTVLTDLTSLKLMSVKMSPQGWKGFIESLVRHEGALDVCLSRVNIDIDTVLDVEASQHFSVRYNQIYSTGNMDLGFSTVVAMETEEVETEEEEEQEQEEEL